MAPSDYGGKCAPVRLAMHAWKWESQISHESCSCGRVLQGFARASRFDDYGEGDSGGEV